MKKLILLLMILLMGVFNLSDTAASEKMLMRFFDEVDTLKATFTQRVTDESGMTLDNASGTFYLSRPGKFRWDYESEDPDLVSGQQIISDGAVITFYEPDLATANQRSYQDAVAQVPTMALVQSGGDLAKHFSINDYGLTDGLNWVALKPKDEDAGYRELMVGFLDGVLNTIVLTDALNNETRLILSRVDNDADIPAEIFEFDAPEGVDLIN